MHCALLRVRERLPHRLSLSLSLSLSSQIRAVQAYANELKEQAALDSSSKKRRVHEAPRDALRALSHYLGSLECGGMDLRKSVQTAMRALETHYLKPAEVEDVLVELMDEWLGVAADGDEIPSAAKSMLAQLDPLLPRLSAILSSPSSSTSARMDYCVAFWKKALDRVMQAQRCFPHVEYPDIAEILTENVVSLLTMACRDRESMERLLAGSNAVLELVETSLEFLESAQGRTKEAIIRHVHAIYMSARCYWTMRSRWRSDVVNVAFLDPKGRHQPPRGDGNDAMLERLLMKRAALHRDDRVAVTVLVTIVSFAEPELLVGPPSFFLESLAEPILRAPQDPQCVGETRSLTLQSLRTWIRRAREIQPLLADDAGLLPLLERVVDIVFWTWDGDETSRVEEATLEAILEGAMGLIDAISPDGTNPWLPLMTRALTQPRHRKGRYAALTAILPHVGAGTMLAACPRLIEDLIEAPLLLGTGTSRPGNLFLRLVRLLLKEKTDAVSKKEKGVARAEARACWLRPVASCLVRGDRSLMRTLTNTLLPQLMRVDPECLVPLLKEIRAQKSSDDGLDHGGDAHLSWAIVEVLWMARECGIAREQKVLGDSNEGLVTREEVRSCALSDSSACRIAAIGVLVGAPKGQTTIPNEAEVLLFQEVSVGSHSKRGNIVR